MFYDLDWDSTNWTEEKLECASQIHTIRYCFSWYFHIEYLYFEFINFFSAFDKMNMQVVFNCH